METLTEVMEKIRVEFKDVLDASNELFKFAGDIMDEINQKDALSTISKSFEKATAILFAEAYGRFLSVKLLCEHGMDYSAMIVQRNLLNLFFILHWILNKQKIERGKRYIGWYWKIMLDKIKDNPESYSVDFKEEALKNWQSISHLYTYEVKSRKSGKMLTKQAKYWYAPVTIEEMAVEIGLREHYDSGYRALSWVEHSDPTSVLSKTMTGIIKHEPMFDKELLAQVLLLNFSYFRFICETVNKTFVLNKKQSLEDFARKLKDFEKLYEPLLNIENNSFKKL